jgi:hypothetical protein
VGINDGSDGGLPTTAMALAPIDVDIDGLDAFRSFMGRELDTNLRPAVEGINNDHAGGADFGMHNPGDQVQRVRQKYFEALLTTVTNLTTYVNLSEDIIQAISLVVAGYQESDLSSSDSIKKVLDEYHVISGARLSDQVQNVTAETHREAHRGGFGS